MSENCIIYLVTINNLLLCLWNIPKKITSLTTLCGFFESSFSSSNSMQACKIFLFFPKNICRKMHLSHIIMRLTNCKVGKIWKCAATRRFSSISHNVADTVPGRFWAGHTRIALFVLVVSRFLRYLFAGMGPERTLTTLHTIYRGVNYRADDV